MYRAASAGAVSRSAIEFCEGRDIRVVAGECPYMLFPDTGPVHRVHRFLKRVTGTLPQWVAYAFINSKSLFTVRQFLPVLVVASFESKYWLVSLVRATPLGSRR
jgi:hypothetical protein